jgi:hypothetical protein
MTEKEVQDYHKTVNDMSKYEEEIQKLQEQQEQIKKKMQKIKREKIQQQRKADTKRKIVIGAKLMKYFDIESPEEADQVGKMFAEYVKGQKRTWKDHDSNIQNEVTVDGENEKLQ